MKNQLGKDTNKATLRWIFQLVNIADGNARLLLKALEAFVWASF